MRSKRAIIGQLIKRSFQVLNLFKYSRLHAFFPKCSFNNECVYLNLSQGTYMFSHSLCYHSTLQVEKLFTKRCSRFSPLFSFSGTLPYGTVIQCSFSFDERERVNVILQLLLRNQRTSFCCFFGKSGYTQTRRKQDFHFWLFRDCLIKLQKQPCL